MRRSSVLLALLLLVSSCAHRDESLLQPELKAKPFDTAALGKDIHWGPFWAPTLDFSDAKVFYFDPNAAPGGNGSLRKPFRDLATELNAGTTILHCDATGDTLNPGAPVGPGDICALLSGDHGSIVFDEYYNQNYLAIIAAPGHTPLFQDFLIRECKRFFVQGLGCTRLRTTFADPGVWYEDAPTLFSVRDDENGNGNSEYIIVKDCRLRSTDNAAAWDSTTWNACAVNALLVEDTNYIHMEHNDFYAVNYGFRTNGVTYGSWVGNTIDCLIGDGIITTPHGGGHLFISGNRFTNFYCVNDNHVDIIQIWDVSVGPTIIEKNLSYHTTDLARASVGPMNGIVLSGGPHEDVEISNNIQFTNSWGGVHAQRSVNCRVVNNTFVMLYSQANVPQYLPFGGSWGCPGIKFYYEDIYPTGCSVRNNVCGYIAPDTTGGIVKSNNLEYLYDCSVAQFTSWVADGDPLSHDVYPALGSALVDSGTSTDAPVDDYAGTVRPQGAGYDIGAYERIQ